MSARGRHILYRNAPLCPVAVDQGQHLPLRKNAYCDENQ